jgi:nucleoside 2-deoxyribosyltransferase
MSKFPLSERQKNLLQSISPGLEDGSVKTEWTIRTGGGRIIAIFGLDDEEGRLWREVWKDNVKEADFAVFERCGFFRQSGDNHYILFEQAIVDAVQDNFSEPQETQVITSANQIVVEPIFGPPLSKTRPWSQVFVLMPFEDNLRPVFDDHIKKVSQKLGLTCERADDIFSAEVIISDVWSAIYYCDVCIVDCTNLNPNVFYELGVAHTLGKRCILIAQSGESFVFDVQHWRHIVYEYTPSGMKSFEEKLEKTLQNELSERSSQIHANNEDREIRPGDVLEAFKKIPDLANDEDAIREDLHSALKELQARGVMFVSQLRNTNHISSVFVD